jgi:hypothetical protein
VTIDLQSAAVLSLGGVGIFSSLSHPRGNQNVAQNPTPIIVRMDKTPRGVAYRVDSKRVSPTPTSNLLYLLVRATHERGSNPPVVVLVDPRVSVADMWTVEGVAAKVPLTNIRYFVLNRESGYMAELKWGPTVPLSTNPN